MDNFKRLSDMLTSIHANFINANSYFMVWQSLEKLINPDEI